MSSKQYLVDTTSFRLDGYSETKMTEEGLKELFSTCVSSSNADGWDDFECWLLDMKRSGLIREV